MKPTQFVMATALVLACAVSAIAQDTVVSVTPDQLKWEATRSLGLVAFLLGDPERDGPYVLRIKVPPNEIDAPHTHRHDENITVLSGWIGFGLGDVVDQSKGQVLPAGSFYHLPASTRHFAWTGAEGAVIQIDGIGPFP